MIITEKQIQAAAYELFNDIMETCRDAAKPEKLCNCVTDKLNTMSIIIPEGEKTQTRKIFNNMVKNVIYLPIVQRD